MSQERLEHDVIIVGAGFAGIYALHKLRSMGLDVLVIEAGSEVGGTWYWNRYPGARCDVPSVEYSFSFDEALQEEWRWSEVMASQSEILQYAKHVADRFDLRRDILFNTEVLSARFDESAAKWALKTKAGGEFVTRFCLMATGCLSVPNMPNLPGAAEFAGEVYHTGTWPHQGVDFTGKTVGVFGTGSSGIQAIPMLAKQARHLTVLQRTPHFTLPANNKPLAEEYVAEVKADYAQIRDKARHSIEGLFGQDFGFGGRNDGRVDESAGSVKNTNPREREQLLDEFGFGAIRRFSDDFTDMEANEMLCELYRKQVRRVVTDPQTAEGLSPYDYPLGCKRIAFDTNYYETFNHSAVTLVDLRREALETITQRGAKTEKADYEFDCLVYATGFDAMTGALMRMDIVGKGGERLRDCWEAGPRSYLGLQVAGFPNLFTITGPGSPSVLSNVMVSIEHHVEWIAECLDYMAQQQLTVIEASLKAQDEWIQEVNQVASATALASPSCSSWYLGSNIDDKPRMFMPYAGGVGNYRAKCDQIVKDNYKGFLMQG